uniref:Uncharacterized protein n=1 Tax=Cyanothece sp. (strain PCC 7425 / ATCC 29141) TaxID=395961 RepID=B8HWI5_CYAP4
MTLSPQAQQEKDNYYALMGALGCEPVADPEGQLCFNRAMGLPDNTTIEDDVYWEFIASLWQQ